MFGILIGAFGTSILSKWFKKNRIMIGNQDGVFMTNYTISDEMYNVIKEYEGFRSKPYLLKGEKKYTIGYGSTYLFLKDGSVRNVKLTDVITREQAFYQVKMYFRNSGYAKSTIDRVIKKSGVKLHQRVYDMLCQIAYGSGSFYRSENMRNILNNADGVTDLNYLAELVRSNYISYLKKLTSAYKINGLGWSRRAYGVYQYIVGGDYTFSNSSKIVKKPY